jgi:hypothetical protein
MAISQSNDETEAVDAALAAVDTDLVDNPTSKTPAAPK